MTLNNTPVYTKNEIVDTLKKQSAIVTFTKKDGTERVMKCTTDNTLIMFKDPTVLESKGSTRKVNEDIMPVYDLESSAWKSFRWDSIKQVSFTL